MPDDFPITWNPSVLARICETLGGSVVPDAQNFQIDLPLDRVKEVLPKLGKLGVGARSVSQRIEEHPTRLKEARTVARLELYRRAADED